MKLITPGWDSLRIQTGGCLIGKLRHVTHLHVTVDEKLVLFQREGRLNRKGRHVMHLCVAVDVKLVLSQTGGCLNRKLRHVTQLYVSVDAATPEALKAIDRPLFKDYWERFQACLSLLRDRQQRTVYRQAAPPPALFPPFPLPWLPL
jgi:hypothetical protein